MKVMQCETPTSLPHASDVEDDRSCDPSPHLHAIDVLVGVSLSMMDVGVFECALQMMMVVTYFIGGSNDWMEQD